MQWRVGNWAFAAMALAPPVGAAGLDLKITILVYNYAGLPQGVMAQAESEAERIYRRADIGMEWLDCPLSREQADQYPACQVAPSPTKLAIRLVPRAMAERYRQAEDTFGFAQYPGDGTFGTVSNVFCHDSEALAKRHGMTHGILLGHLMAHEIGHLLLGAGSHAASGIMHVPWHKRELEMIAQRFLLFLPNEEEQLRASIRARVSLEKALLPAANAR